jgi:PPIC-type PPIASE domain
MLDCSVRGRLHRRETRRPKCRSRSSTGLISLCTALIAVIGIAAAAIGLTACGASAPAHTFTQTRAASEQLRGQAEPGSVVARVGPYSITGATFNRSLKAQPSSEPGAEQLVPPRFSACVAHLQAELAVIAERPPPPSQLRSECQTRYQALAQTVLNRLISNAWLIAGARELGVPISNQEAQASLDHYRREHFSSEARFRRFLAGRTLADLAFETRAKLASQAIHRAIVNRVRPITKAQIESYYEQHRFQYLVAAERDLKIARAKTQASAATARAELASGKSIASVVKRLPIRQPIDSKEGLVLELHPHVYGEPNLDQAIFTATPGVLRGPINTWFGYFVFEVTKVIYQHERPLAQVQASIRRQLASPLQERALAAFDRQWRATWTARTECSPGFVVPKCGRP